MAVEPITKAHSARRPAVARRRPAKAARRKQQLSRIQAERAVKAAVRERDQTCRWPGCDCQRSWGAAQGQQWYRALEVAHLDDKGMGGDKKLLRTRKDRMIYLCAWRHRGQFGLHAKRARIEPLTDKGTDGPCLFTVQRKKDGTWEVVGVG